jgi:GPH family glycoside/pentoside/hexuronide:cation symporter
MALPAFISAIALLCVPQSLSDTGKFIYAIVTNLLASAIICTAISVPYSCLLTFRTQNQNERTAMNVHRTICNFTTGIFFNIAFIPITNIFGGTQSSWIKVGIVLAFIGAAGMIICFKTTQEVTMVESESTKQSETKFMEGIKRLITNKYWVIMALAQLIANIIYSLSGSTNTYYAKWLFGNENIIAIMGAISIIPTLVGFVIVTPLVKKFGPVNVIRFSFLFGIIGSLIRIIFPYSFGAICVGGALISASTLPFMMVGMVLIADVADFEFWRSKKPLVGMVNSASSFGAKVGGGIGSGIIGLILSVFGYASHAATQTSRAITGIFVISNWLPGILITIMLILMLLYDIDKKYPDFKNDLNNKTKNKEK